MRPIARFLVGMIPSLGACGGKADQTETAAPCEAVTPWAPGTPIFADATAEWGLADMGAVAQRFHVADFDGDG